MLDITIKNFEADVIKASTLHPVLLDIWAPWCGPCKALGPVLEKLEMAYAGRFTLGKLNSDEQPEIAGQLSQMFGVRSIPFCVLFKDGQPVDGFVGALPEVEVRQFLDNHVPSVDEVTAQEDAAEAAELLAEGDKEHAIEKLKEAVALDPANDGTRADYVRALLFAGRWQEAREAFAPVAGKASLDAQLSACDHWLRAFESVESGRSVDQLQAAVTANKRDFEARFELAQRHFARAEFTQAMDELLEILMRDKSWGDQKARTMYVAILATVERTLNVAKYETAQATNKEHLELPVWPANRVDQTTDKYRRKLSMALF